MRYSLLAVLLLGASLICPRPAFAVGGTSDECALGIDRLHRGQSRTLLLCHADIGPGHRLVPTPQSGLQFTYQQFLERCDFHDERPGIHAVLTAGAYARSGTFSVQAPGAEPVCTAPAIEVPPELLLAETSLKPMPGTAGGHYRLAVRLPDGTRLAAACSDVSARVSAPGFLTVPADTTIRCDGNSIVIGVTVRHGPQDPAILLVGPVRDAAGQVRTGVAHIPPPRAAWQDAMRAETARFVNVAGIRTRYFDAGDGEVVVLVHGGQPSAPDFNAWDWQQNFGALARRFRVIAPDRVGQGETANPPQLDDYSDYYPLVVRHLEAFLRELQVERVHLVGHSQGGWPVTRLAIDRPDLVASLTIVNSTMIAPAANATQAMRFYLYHTRHLHPPEGETVQSIRRGMESFSHTRHNVTDERVRQILAFSRQPKYHAARDWFGRSGMSPAHKSFRALKAQVWSELEAGRLRVPTLVIWGLRDPEGSYAAGENLFRALADAGTPVELHAFSESGHVPYMEFPDAFNEVVAAFVARNAVRMPRR